MPPLEDLKRELKFHGQRLAANRLIYAARFVNELMVSVSEFSSLSPIALRFVSENTDTSRSFKQMYRDDYDSPNADKLQLARTLYDTRELKRCAHVLKAYEVNPDCQSSLFLYNYALYMHGSQRREEEIFERNKSKQYAGIKVSDSSVCNQQSKNLVRGLERLYNEDRLDDMNTYMYGLVLVDIQRYEDASKAFIKCLNLNPLHWSAWQELARLIIQDEIKKDWFEALSSIKDHWMKNMFLASLLHEKVKLVETFDKYCLDMLTGLLCFFRDSSYLISQVAQLFYHKKDQEMAIQIYQELLRKDPYRIDTLDVYSNILYVKDNPKDLGALAYNCFQNNKYAPETNCIIGNYHSLMSEHEKAITYFKNALALDRTFLAAWTLIGHEYLELKKVANAIDAYNHAVKIDNKDFRAWYGLGQAYELQSLLPKSIHYYLMAVKTRPRDYRMWNALSTVYNKIDKPEEAAKCSERAENYKDDERIALFNLAKIYDSLGLTEKAVQCFIENLNRIDSSHNHETVGIAYSRISDRPSST